MNPRANGANNRYGPVRWTSNVISSRVPSVSENKRYVLWVCPMFERASASQPSGGCKRTRNRATNGNAMTPVSSISTRSPSRRITLRVRSRTRLNSGSLSRNSVHQEYTSGREARNRFVTRKSTGAEFAGGTKRPRRRPRFVNHSRAFSAPLIDSESHGRERRRADSPYTCEIGVNGRVVCQKSRLEPTDVLSQHEGRKTGSHLSLFSVS